MMKEVSFWPGNPVSYTTTRMEMFFGEQLLSVGTGFVMKYAGQYGLVTNWHVLTGRSPIDGRCLSRTGGIPNRTQFHVALSKAGTKDGRPSETLHFKPIDLSLFKDEDCAVPIWWDEKVEEKQSDYAVIMLRDVLPELSDPRYSLRAIEGGKVTLKRGVKPSPRVRSEDINHFYPPVGHQLFVVGYPAGIEPSGIFPIWKGGTIASEPSAGLKLGDVTTDDVFLVDGLTRAGMSGSPVICLEKPGDRYYTDDGVEVTADKEGSLLVGVYAGREGVTASEADLALGRVWKIGALERLLAKAARHDEN